jgi:delta 1-pyrroline-5-carboxylate dehydrogenase
MQFATVLAAGARAIWLENGASVRRQRDLPADLRPLIVLDDSLRSAFDAILIQADEADVRAWSHRLAQRDGPTVGNEAIPGLAPS